jgi:hypothetical protein
MASASRSMSPRLASNRRPGPQDVQPVAERFAAGQATAALPRRGAEPRQGRPLQRYLGRRVHFQETALAIAGLVSDRAAR